MKKLVTIVSDVRVHALLCCSAAVLLTACGGGTSDTGNEPQSPALLASVTVEDQAITITSPDTTEAMGAQIVQAAANASVDDNGMQATFQQEAPPPEAASLLAIAASEPNVTLAPSTYHLYVATTGNDANAGSRTAPFRTINRATRAAKPSTTIHVAAGTYRENVRTTVHGSATARISYVSDTKWGAKVIGSGTEAMWTNSANYTDIVGFDISGPGRLGILNNGSYTLASGNHVHHITVSGGCNGGGGAGIVNGNYNGSNTEVIGNVVNDIGVPGRCNGVQGIYTSNKNGKINNNIVYRVSAYGIHLWHAATNIVIANNTVFANGAGGMGGGMMLGTGDSPGGIVLNNTSVINNIVYRNPAAGIKQYCYSGQSCIGSTNVTANNLVFGNGTNITMRRGSATGTVSAEPQFVNYQANGSGDYRLRSSSPAVNRGTATTAPTYDIDNVARPRGAAHDIGAYESF